MFKRHEVKNSEGKVAVLSTVPQNALFFDKASYYVMIMGGSVSEPGA